jgi:hypothetical protein
VSAQPADAPAAALHLARHREAGDDVAAGAGRHDDQVRHHCAPSAHERAVFDVHPQHDRQRHQVHQDRRAAVAHQRQGQPLGGQHAQVHAHVDEGLAADPDADALHHQAGEHAVERDGLAADDEDAARQPEEQATMTQATPTKPSSSPITASRKSVCASGR